MKFIALLSGGKDSVLAMMHAMFYLGHELVCVGNLAPDIASTASLNDLPAPSSNTTPTDDLDSYSFQTVGYNVVPLLTQCITIRSRNELPNIMRNEGPSEGGVGGATPETSNKDNHHHQVPFRSALIKKGQSVQRGLLYSERNAGRPLDTGVGMGDTIDEIEVLYELLRSIKVEFPDVQGVTTGAILSHYQRNRVENVCRRLGLTSIAPLWQWPADAVLRAVNDIYQLTAIIVKVSSMGLVPQRHLGSSVTSLTPYLLSLGAKGVHPAGEGGEFESIVLDAPIFMTSKLRIEASTTVIVDGNPIAPTGYLQINRIAIVPKTIDEQREAWSALSNLCRLCKEDSTWRAEVGKTLVCQTLLLSSSPKDCSTTEPNGSSPLLPALKLLGQTGIDVVPFHLPTVVLPQSLFDDGPRGNTRDEEPFLCLVRWNNIGASCLSDPSLLSTSKGNEELSPPPLQQSSAAAAVVPSPPTIVEEFIRKTQWLSTSLFPPVVAETDTSGEGTAHSLGEQGAGMDGLRFLESQFAPAVLQLLHSMENSGRTSGSIDVASVELLYAVPTCVLLQSSELTPQIFAQVNAHYSALQELLLRWCVIQQERQSWCVGQVILPNTTAAAKNNDASCVPPPLGPLCRAFLSDADNVKNVLALNLEFFCLWKIRSNHHAVNDVAPASNSCLTQRLPQTGRAYRLAIQRHTPLDIQSLSHWSAAAIGPYALANCLSICIEPTPSLIPQDTDENEDCRYSMYYVVVSGRIAQEPTTLNLIVPLPSPTTSPREGDHLSPSCVPQPWTLIDDDDRSPLGRFLQHTLALELVACAVNSFVAWEHFRTHMPEINTAFQEIVRGKQSGARHHKESGVPSLSSDSVDIDVVAFLNTRKLLSLFQTSKQVSCSTRSPAGGGAMINCPNRLMKEEGDLNHAAQSLMRLCWDRFIESINAEVGTEGSLRPSSSSAPCWPMSQSPFGPLPFAQRSSVMGDSLDGKNEVRPLTGSRPSVFRTKHWRLYRATELPKNALVELQLSFAISNDQ